MADEIPSTQLQAPLPVSGQSSPWWLISGAIAGLILGGIAGATKHGSVSGAVRGAVALAIIFTFCSAWGTRGWLSRATLCGISMGVACFTLLVGQDWNHLFWFGFFLSWGVTGIL